VTAIEAAAGFPPAALVADRIVTAGAQGCGFDQDAELFMSAAIWWELGIKRALGRLEIDIGFARRGSEQRGVRMLPITGDHAETATALPVLHNDPFDHMLVAQAISERLVLLTRDAKLKKYGSAVLCT
jgi:PIN domain nuclease of toxin-antitoxin system